MKREPIKEKINANKLLLGQKLNQKINYTLFTCLTFKGLNNNGQVILQDKDGNIKTIDRKLFEKMLR